ncbi:hypothetical protein [Streptomyces sundarbansensis]
MSSHVVGERVRRTELLSTADRKTWSTASPSSTTSSTTGPPGAQPKDRPRRPPPGPLALLPRVEPRLGLRDGDYAVIGAWLRRRAAS